MGTDDDPRDPRLTRGADDQPVDQAGAYLVLPADERAPAAFVRPVRQTYRHTTCGNVTTMARAIAETYAHEPTFYGATFCVSCQMHRPVWIEADGTDGPEVGT